MSKPNEPVNARYGAPMGRYTGPDVLAGKVNLGRVRLDSGGYDPGGAYWGIGAPLYYAFDEDGNSQYLRARDRAEAKAKLKDRFGDDINFYR